MKRVAIIDKAPSRVNYSEHFEFEYEVFHMVDHPIKKLLKKDVTLQFDPEPYELVILVGSEAAKEYAKVTSVTTMMGQLVNNKFICIPSPAVLIFKPEGRNDFLKAVSRIKSVYEKGVQQVTEGDYSGINDTEIAKEYILEVLNNANTIVAWDTETTALYPRDGYVLGLSLSYTTKQGRYILTDCLDNECIDLLQQISCKFKAVFHNMKFDYKMIKFHLGIEFDRNNVADTMLMHYVLDENSSHSLKALALKYTDYGHYDEELDTYKREYCKNKSMLLEDFTYDLIPYETISQYACLTHDSQVFMEGGGLKTIGELVRSRSTEKVLSYNEVFNVVEPRSIDGWVKIAHPSKEWYSVVMRIGSDKISDTLYKGPKYTKDHKILTIDKGWVEVQSLSPGDRILSQEKELTEDAYQILRGSLLGDGRFDSRNNNGAGFVVSQAEPRGEYASFKARALGCTVHSVKEANSAANRNTVHMYTSPYSLLYSDLYHSFKRRDGTAYCKPSIDDDFCALIDVRAIAIWYMDDGNLANGRQPRIWSRTTSEEEVSCILARLAQLGVPGGYLCEDVNSNNRFITFKTEDASVFFEAVSEYIHDDCRYKLPSAYAKNTRRHTWNFDSDKYYYAKIVDIVPWEPPSSKRGYSTKWCINVEGNHNFFTKTGLVHNCIDTAVTYDLYNKFWPIIEKNESLLNVYNELLLAGTLFLMDMEEVGIPVNKDRLLMAQAYLDAEIVKAKEEIYSYEEVKRYQEITGTIFNPNSVNQLRVLLFDYIGLTPTGKKTGTGAISTDKDVLEELGAEHPLPRTILRVKQLIKMRSTYTTKILGGMDRDGRIRTNFNIVFTTSGRLSSSGKFNAQQIPRDDSLIKACIQAPPGYSIVSQDLRTAEVYYAAVLSKDKNLQDVFKLGGDLHSTIAKMVFNLDCDASEVKRLYPELRQAAKAITFGIMYGSGAAKVAETVSKELGSPYPITQAQEDINAYFTKFSGLKRWLKEQKDIILAQGYIYTFFGRKRRLPNVFSADKAIASHEVRSGINAEIQSVASDVNLLGAMDTAYEVKVAQIDAKIFMLVHDSIVAIVRNDHVQQYCEVLKRCTQKDRGCSILGSPIGVDQDIGQDYSFGHFEEQYAVTDNKLARIPFKK